MSTTNSFAETVGNGATVATLIVLVAGVSKLRERGEEKKNHLTAALYIKMCCLSCAPDVAVPRG